MIGKKIAAMINIAKRKIKNIRMRKYQKQLSALKYYQFEKFGDLSERFADFYYKINNYDISRFTTPLWEKYNKLLERMFLPRPPFAFLRIPTIKNTMFVSIGGNWMREEIDFLEKKVSGEKLKSLLLEDYCGDPILSSSKYMASHNSIHHLYHLIRFSEKVDLKTINNIVEWGGGYGNTAKIFKRLNDNNITYTIIDTPLFGCMQWIYLATIFGDEQINFITEPGQDIKSNKINLLPICFLENYDLKGKLFIAEWSLSESSKYSQDYVESCNFFESKHLLLAYQESSDRVPYANRVGTIAEKKGAEIERIDFLPGSGNYYAFK